MDLDRVAGGLVGVAIGDALGVPVEGVSRERLSREPVTGMGGNGAHHQPSGTWSDDSSLTFCTAESLMNGLDLSDMGQRFLRWLQEGYWTPHGAAFGIGGTTWEALQRLARGVPAGEAGPTGEGANGNGSLMRILPVAVRFAGEDLSAALEKAHLASRVTHGHPRAQIACGIYVAMARRLLAGERPAGAYQATVAEARDYHDSTEYAPELPHYSRVLDGRLQDLAEGDIQSDGYVVHTLEASLWCLVTSAGFSEAVLKAVNLGGDSDTTGAVTGGLAGAAYGLRAIPDEWLSVLARTDDILELANRLWKSGK